ncbi:hypothetical protein WQQ_10230 [Hydrocarboniphaga effusa AP103]|uniref:Uncharacterized protein n=1 Tax=Hydrocarboniphaga effusa AP103 TaxID=1172194 RepID=I8I415_9GAMM|nr:hypothetical protein WQQ_10230 [Hydrocarboniphaga effusa AP103]
MRRNRPVFPLERRRRKRHEDFFMLFPIDAVCLLLRKALRFFDQWKYSS